MYYFMGEYQGSNKDIKKGIPYHLNIQHKYQKVCIDEESQKYIKVSIGFLVKFISVGIKDDDYVSYLFYRNLNSFYNDWKRYSMKDYKRGE